MRRLPTVYRLSIGCLSVERWSVERWSVERWYIVVRGAISGRLAMKIFLSYPSNHREVAERACYALEAERHSVFFDRQDLAAGQAYHGRIRQEILECDLFIFFITPRSVAEGYAASEMDLASRKSSGNVLPVMMEETDLDDVPAFLKAGVSILYPKGDIPAQIVWRVAEIAESLVDGEGEGASDGEDSSPRGGGVVSGAVSGAVSDTYEPLEIRFGAGARDGYPVAVRQPASGAEASRFCGLNPAELEDQLWASASASDSAIRGAAGGSLLPSVESVRQVGATLYEEIFAGDASIQPTLRSLVRQQGPGLRFLINTTDAPELARMPWEFAYNRRDDDFIFSDVKSPVVRWLDLEQPLPTLRVEGPLKLLIAVATPEDRPELRVGEELAQLGDALGELAKGGVVQPLSLPHATLESLNQALIEERPHILHFVGHGEFVGDDGVIVFESHDRPGTSDPIPGRRLAVLLRNHLASLRLVFLNNCLGAAVSRQDAFGGMAQSLIRRGVPAVVAMQFPISDPAAVALARVFYQGLAAGHSVDAALTSARGFLFARGFEVEWGSPALYMRAADGRIFDFLPGSSTAVSEDRALPAPLPPPPSSPSEPSPTGRGGADAAARGETPAQTWRRATEAVAVPEEARARPALWLAMAAVVVLALGASIFFFPMRELGTVEMASTGMPSSNSPVGEDTDPLPSVPPPPPVPLPRKQEPLESSLAQSPVSAAHRVEPGDNLWEIARRHYGDPLLWIVIRDANRDALAGSPDYLPVDLDLELPPWPPKERAVGAGDAYVVQPGDSLSGIARQLYGDSRRWPAILQANLECIEAPDRLYPNQTLEIPDPDSVAISNP